MYEIRDPIHGTVGFTDRERRVIDHRFVQRLRHVRQLGLGYLVYPGATHDRFSHSIGAMHVAGRIWDRMLENCGDVFRAHFEDFDLEYFRRILRLAGLLHDIGHPPFSHVSEQLMPKINQLRLPFGWMRVDDAERRARHEDYGVALIAALSREADSPLPPDEAQDIASLVHHDVSPSPSWEKRFGAASEGRVGIHRLLRSLISGELDCDRMDYLLRDAYYTGVAYGKYDMDHLIGNLGVAERDGILMPTVDSTAVRAFEDFLLARYHMFLQVYLHKTVVSFDRLLERAMTCGEVGLDIPGDAEGFARLRDSTVIERLHAAAEDPANAWSRRLIARVPLKTVFKCDNSSEDDRAILSRLIVALERGRVPFFRVDSRQHLSSSWSGRTPTGLLVRRKMFGRIVFEPMERYSDLLTKYNETIDLSNLYVLRDDFASAQQVIRDLGWPVVAGSAGKQGSLV